MVEYEQGTHFVTLSGEINQCPSEQNTMTQNALLALDQVLSNTWSYLTVFGLRQPVKDGAPGEVDITGSRSTFGPLLGFWVNVMGKGCRPMGLPTFRPTFVNA
jgi:hypothetical protein